MLLVLLDLELSEVMDSVASFTEHSFPLHITMTVQKSGAFLATNFGILSPLKALIIIKIRSRNIECNIFQCKLLSGTCLEKGLLDDVPNTSLVSPSLNI